jgi:hypothetical protein
MEANALDRFLETLKRHHRARLSLVVEVVAAGRLVASFAGRYVALRPRPAPS